MYKDINLLPDKILYKNINTARLVFRTLLIFLVLSVLIAAALYLPYKRYMEEKRLADITAMVNTPQLRELNDAEERLSQKQREIDEFNKLYSSIPDNKLRPTALIARISSLMPPGMKAVNINYKAESLLASIDFIAASRNDISLFLKSLYNDSSFTDVNISTITGRDNTFSFTITVRYIGSTAK